METSLEEFLALGAVAKKLSELSLRYKESKPELGDDVYLCYPSTQNQIDLNAAHFELRFSNVEQAESFISTVRTEFGDHVLITGPTFSHTAAFKVGVRIHVRRAVEYVAKQKSSSTKERFWGPSFTV